MEENIELSRIEKIGNVYLCPCGIVHVNIRGVSLHFSGEAFIGFASMLKNASSLLMDIGIAGLMEDNN